MKQMHLLLLPMVLVIGSALPFLCRHAQADQITVTDTFQYRLNTGPNTVGDSVGEGVKFGAESVVPNGANGTTATAVQGNITLPLNFKPFAGALPAAPALPNAFRSGYHKGAKLTGPSWTLTFTNGADSRAVPTPDLVGAPKVPLVRSVTKSGNGLAPTFRWIMPGGFVPDSALAVLLDLQVADPGSSPLYATFLDAPHTGFTLPASLLSKGQKYCMAVILVKTRTSSPMTLWRQPDLLSISQTYYSFSTPPLLVETSVGDPPAETWSGKQFPVNDTVQNQGLSKTVSTTTRYYLSTSTNKDPSATLLTGKRTVPPLGPGASSVGTVKVTVPPGMAPGSYNLLACADDTNSSVGADDQSCAASSSKVTVPNYTMADLVGTWMVNSLASGPGAPWWLRATVKVKPDGTVTGTAMESDGHKSQLKSKVSISSDGLMTLQTKDNFDCRMDAGKTVVACTGTWPDWMQGTTELNVWTKKAASYSLKDLPGNWEGDSIVSGPGAPWWGRTSFTINKDGTFNATTRQNETPDDVSSGSFSFGAGGLITMRGAKIAPNTRCSLDAGKTFLACTNTWSDGSTSIAVAGKKALTYATADLAGTWDLHSLASGPGAPWWETASATIDQDGTFTMPWGDSKPTSGIANGTMSINQDGVITRTDKPNQECRMDSDKTIFTCTDTWNDGTTSFTVGVKRIVTPE